VQPAEIGDSLAHFDVGAAPGHVGGNRHFGRGVRRGDDVGLGLDVLALRT